MRVKAIDKNIYKKYAREKNFYAGAIIEITSECTFNCIHCYNDIDKKHIPMKEMKELVKKIKDMGVVFVTLTGGEATLHPQFEEIYIHLKENGFLVTLFTNLSKINQFEKTISTYRPLRISASLYGLSETDYKVFTGVEVFQQIHRTILWVKEKKINLEIKVLITSLNYESVMKSEYQNYADEIGVPIIYDPFLFISKNKNVTPLKYRVSARQAANVLLKYHSIPIEKITELSPMQFYCENGNSYCHVDVEGNFSICLKDYKKISCMEETNSIIMFLKKRSKENKENADKIECSKCNYNLGCGWCPLEFEFDSKEDFRDNYFCEVRHYYMCGRDDENEYKKSN